MIRILGIDPGSRLTGYGIIDTDGQHSRCVDFGTIRLKENRLPEKLGMIFNEVAALIDVRQPAEMAIEDVFMAKNAGSALKLGQARGAAICAGVQAGLVVAEYTPRYVKQAVVGTGAADKTQVQHMVKLMLNIKEQMSEDASDALAIALCHAHLRTASERILQAGVQ